MKRMVYFWVVMSLMLAPVASALAGDVASRSSVSYGQAPGSCCPGTDEEATASTPPGELILIDGLVLRPFGLAAMGVGAIGSLILMPFTATSNSCYQVRKELLEKPFDYTFVRPLGDVDY